MRITRRAWIGAFSAAIVVSPAVWAHRLIPNDGTHVNADAAIRLSDINVSQVAYQEIAAYSPQLWLTFTAEADNELYLQLGVPQLERLKTFRPAYAILGPGLPTVTAPFPIPEGYGGWIFTTDGVADPETFHEPFTGTDSWTFPATDVVLPYGGRYYVVAYSPSDDTGKLWVAVGKTEEFTVLDILQLPQVIFSVRQFHEVCPIGGVAGWGLFLLAAAVVTGLVFLVKWLVGIHA